MISKLTNQGLPRVRWSSQKRCLCLNKQSPNSTHGCFQNMMSSCRAYPLPASLSGGASISLTASWNKWATTGTDRRSDFYRRGPNTLIDLMIFSFFARDETGVMITSSTISWGHHAFTASKPISSPESNSPSRRLKPRTPRIIWSCLRSWSSLRI